MQNAKFMEIAIKESKKSLLHNDVPVGCIIVKDNKIIAKAHNQRVKKKSTIAHCEIIAIDKACKKLGDWRLSGCSMYVTLEPCQMCAGAIVQSRLDRLYIGTMNPKSGCCGTILNLLDVNRFNHKVEVISGIMEDECSKTISDFFVKLRGRNG